MKQLTRTIVGIGIGLLTLGLVAPTVSTASADSYGSSSNSGAVAAGVVLGGVALYGLVDLLTTPAPTSKPTPPAQ